jgi:hypothetical protein
MSLTDRIWKERGEWARAHGNVFPTQIYLSPLATVRIMRATCGTSAVKPEMIEHGETANVLWTVKRFARDVLQMDWFEDTRLTGESFRFA